MIKTMKRISKIAYLLTLLTFVVACNKDVEIKEFNSAVTYNSAKGYYWGNYYGTGTANFQLCLYSDTDEKIGILIDGYATLPSNPANFKLDAGTYFVAETEAVRTVFPADEDLNATYAFNERTKRYILVTGGSFTVEVTSERGKSNIYTIETNFTGREINTNTTVNDIRIKFTGAITFEDKTFSFDDIKQSTYTANGALYPNRAISWTGEVSPKDDETGLYYAITNWYNTANYNLTGALWLDYNEGKLVLDDRTKVGEYGNDDLYFGASYYTGRNWEAVPNYTVSYNKTTRILDFSGTYDGYPVYVGLFGKHYITGDEIVYENCQVKEAKLVLTTSGHYSSALKSARSVVSETSRKSVSNTSSVNPTATRSQSVIKKSSGIQNRASKSVQRLKEN